MNRLTLADARRLALATAGALAISAMCVAGAVAPAYGQPASRDASLTVAEWQATIGAQLDAELRVPAAALAGRDHLLAVVAVSFDADGSFTGARVAQSSGHPAVDARVVRIARGIAYPPLPAAYRGTARTVVMQAWFGEAADAPGAPVEADATADTLRAAPPIAA